MRVSTSRVLLLLLVLLAPISLFVFLQTRPDLDPTFDAPLFHFYIVTFTSFIALVAALTVATALPRASSSRAFFVTLAFTSIAAIFVLHALATPGILIPGFNQAVGWSARLSLAAGAFYFVLATIPWSPRAEAWLLAHRRRVWLLSAIVYAAYAGVAFGYPRPLELLSQMEPGINYGLAAIVVGAFLWAARHAWRNYMKGGSRLEGYLAVALVLLGEAQISQVFGPLWQLSWWLYHILMLVGFILAMVAISVEFEALRDFRPARYFAALGSIASIGLALLSGEVAVRWIGMTELRVPILSLVLLVTATLFVVSYAIVVRADRLVAERTTALRKEQTLRRELTNLIVHDLKNPLAAIIGSLSAVSSGVTGAMNEVQARFIQRSEQAGRDAVRLIDDLLDVERLEAGALKLQLDALPLAEMLQTRVEAMEGLARQRSQALKLELPEQLPHPEGDRTLLERVVDNLLTNAIKYTPDGGHIEVRAHATNGWVSVSVADDGPGVPHAERERIFEKFGQVAGTERRGAGLGLAFCKMTVEAHKGSIQVGDNDGGGAVFTFTLPVSC